MEREMGMQDAALDLAIENLHARFRARGWRVAVAESCTGGLLAAALTDRPGASLVFDRGFVTYSNYAKTSLLGVPEDMLRAHGAVSAPVAAAMASGCLFASAAKLAISVTGIAGPGGGSAEKPVGLVFIGAHAENGAAEVVEHRFQMTDRREIRRASVLAALDLATRMAA